MSDPISLYIHIPFCVRKCFYCDFYSETRLDRIPDYLVALEKEIRLRRMPDQAVDTIYLGGGTPSLLEARQVEHLLAHLRTGFRVCAGAEITLEVNPGTVDGSKLVDLKQAGINRLSVGVQSFNNDRLRFLGRIHDGARALAAIDQAFGAGFDNVGLDLIYGLPGDTRKAWRSDLNRALQAGPTHLSCYMLTIEPGTPLHRQAMDNAFVACNPEKKAGLFKWTSRFLAEAGFEHYEISSFAGGRASRSRHNSRYWDLAPYLGFGAAAHSYDGRSRFWNHGSIDAYIGDLFSGRMPVGGTEVLTRKERMTEYVMLRLRTLDGLDADDFEARFQVGFQTLFRGLPDCIADQGLGRWSDRCFSLSLEGRTRLNAIVESFVEKID